MSVTFKFKESVGEERRREIIHVLDRAGYAARSLFPGQKRPGLASIFTVSQTADPKVLGKALSSYNTDIEYIEAAPDRKVK